MSQEHESYASQQRAHRPGRPKARTREDLFASLPLTVEAGCPQTVAREPSAASLAVVDFCKQNNGGCAKTAKCSQKGTQVSCSCQRGYQGDGHSCTEVDPCADGVNGGCHEHATCRMTGPVSPTSLETDIWDCSSWGPAQPGVLLPGLCLPFGLCSPPSSVRF